MQNIWGLSSWLLYPFEPSLQLSSVLDPVFPIGGTPPAPHWPLSTSMSRPKQWDPTSERISWLKED